MQKIAKRNLQSLYYSEIPQANSHAMVFNALEHFDQSYKGIQEDSPQSSQETTDWVLYWVLIRMDYIGFISDKIRLRWFLIRLD